ncbi:hypothetical protein ACF9IK_36620 [Kitasatospora hibisci]|uniref:hypothetical protein n=1 Tax=Kitasatospora hibisci TaxID=3369522 RepID=UPI003753F326
MALSAWDCDGDLYCVLTTEIGVGEGRTVHFELSEACVVPGGGPSVPAAPAPGVAAVTVVAYPPGEEEPAEVFFDEAQTLPFAVVHHFAVTVAARLPIAGL